MGFIKSILGVLGGAIGLAQSIWTGKEREKDREAGRNEAKVEGHEDAADARARIDAVKPAGPGATVGKLRKGKF